MFILLLAFCIIGSFHVVMCYTELDFIGITAIVLIYYFAAAVFLIFTSVSFNL